MSSAATALSVLPNGRSLLWELNDIWYSHGLFQGHLLHASFKIGETATVTHEMVRTAHADHPWANLSGMLHFNRSEFQAKMYERSGQHSVGYEDKYEEKTPKIILEK